MSGTKKSKALVMVLVFTMFLSIMASSFAYAGTPVSTTISDANFTITRKISSTNVLLNSEVTITYTVTPADINVEIVTPKKKEFILVLDTSDSMDKNKIGTKSRREVAIEAAKNFLTKMETLNATYPDTIKAGLIDFNKQANVRTYDGKVLTSNFSDANGIKKTLSNIGTSNGTNIGDALRRAYYVLKNSTSDAEKYIILLSDGEPSSWTLKDSNGNKDHYFKDDGTGTTVLNSWEQGSKYSSRPKDYFIEIAKMMGNYNASNPTKKIEPFMIAYSEGSNRILLEDRNVEAGGSKSNVYSANSSQELIDVFANIGDVIAKDFAIKDIVFKESFPVGLTLPGGLQNFVHNIDTIHYTLNAAKTKYTAAPITFSITVKCDTAGNYILSDGANPSTITYKDINDNNVNTGLSSYSINVAALGIPDITVSKTVDPVNTIIDSPVTSTYTINPGVIPFPAGIPEEDLPAILTIENPKIVETLPDGLVIPEDLLPPGATIVDNVLTIPLGDIVYVKDEVNNIYVPQNPAPVIELPIIPEEEGDFSWTGEIIYNDFYGNTHVNEFESETFGSSTYGTPTVTVTNVVKRGDVVDVTVKYTIPTFTAAATITKEGKDPTTLGPESSGSTFTETYTNLSIYKDHKVTITSTSVTSVSRSIDLLIYDAINVN